MKAWIARNSNGMLLLFWGSKPWFKQSSGEWYKRKGRVFRYGFYIGAHRNMTEIKRGGCWKLKMEVGK